MSRSYLFAPGNHARRVEKAFTLGADAVILDLEDAVAVSEKEAARRPVAAALAARKGGSRGYVRVNAMGTPFCFRDLTEVVGKGVDGIVLPKVESAADLHAIDWLIANLERERGLAVGAIDLIPTIETAAGLQRVERILQARGLKPYSGTWRVRRVAFGAADYALDLGITPGDSGEELLYARQRLVLASRDANVEPPLDSPWFKLKDLEGLRASIAASRRMGFQGRMCIHPEQVAPVNEGYAPAAAEVAQAERIVAAFKEAEAKGLAAIQVDGRMIDYPIVREAERVLKAAGRTAG
ncbi:MAG TPA: CoA ester lyase [Burkholderiales bacterium]|jgi:citrate lyase subunit beta/citryl-CoA lyase|nr:CoA ester lyase [Burkholderiales bacterium]